MYGEADQDQKLDDAKLKKALKRQREREHEDIELDDRKRQYIPPPSSPPPDTHQIPGATLLPPHHRMGPAPPFLVIVASLTSHELSERIRLQLTTCCSQPRALSCNPHATLNDQPRAPSRVLASSTSPELITSDGVCSSPI